jgi:hypothetical protein
LTLKEEKEKEEAEHEQKLISSSLLVYFTIRLRHTLSNDIEALHCKTVEKEGNEAS